MPVRAAAQRGVYYDIAEERVAERGLGQGRGASAPGAPVVQRPQRVVDVIVVVSGRGKGNVAVVSKGAVEREGEQNITGSVKIGRIFVAFNDRPCAFCLHYVINVDSGDAI